VKPDHPVQRDIRNTLEAVMQETPHAQDYATDGCSIPTCAFSLAALARGFAKLAGDARAEVLLRACAAEPFYVAGSKRFDTEIIALFGARAYVKTGAEGVYCGVLPELNIGFALKCLDGATRAAECMTANLIDALLPMNDDERAKLAPLCAPMLTAWRGAEVGKINIANGLKKALQAL
jgi:L-asparaginase II